MNWYGMGNTAHSGLLAEINFCLTALHYGAMCLPATQDENRNRHIDLYLTLNGDTVVAVDVKGMKRLARRGALQDTWAWLELRNGKGDNGWLYGDADVIAFERLDTFWLVDREQLARRVRDIVSPSRVESPSEAAYKLYQRRGRDDLLTLVHYEAMRPSLLFVWEKVVCLT